MSFVVSHKNCYFATLLEINNVHNKCKGNERNISICVTYFTVASFVNSFLKLRKVIRSSNSAIQYKVLL